MATKTSNLGRRFLDNADVEIRSAMKSRTIENICDRIECARVLLKLALKEYKKEMLANDANDIGNN